jgi:hypothetical protein
MKNAAAALTVAMTVAAQPPALARDGFAAGIVVNSTIAGLLASGYGYSAEYGYVAAAPAIFGYGYRATYYGNGFSYQPAWYPGYAYYARPQYFRGCCRW